MMGGGRGTGPGPEGNNYGWGNGMMHHGGGMGMMHGGQGMGPQYRYERRPLIEKDVKIILENYLRSTRNPNLKLGKIEDKGPVFEAEILTKDDSLVDRVEVDKATGGMSSIYQ